MQERDPIAFARDMARVVPPLKLLGRRRNPPDGLYRVATRRRVYGGYLVHRGRVTRCSPAVRRRIHIWAHQAQYWEDLATCFISRRGADRADRTLE